jgi:hypothetical protein
MLASYYVEIQLAEDLERNSAGAAAKAGSYFARYSVLREGGSVTS